MSETPSDQPTAEMPLPDAVLWDMDGTLVDTEPHWFAAEGRLMRAHGLPWTDEDSLALVGGDLEVSAAVMAAAGLPLGVRETVDALCADVAEGVRRELNLRPGALELLVALRRAGVPTALVTNSEAKVADVVVAKLTAIAAEGADPATAWSGPLFDVTVTGDIALPVKPDPAPYLFAARRLAGLHAEGALPAQGGSDAQDGPAAQSTRETAQPELSISRMVAIEDSLTGLAAALAAGPLTLAVPNIVDLSAAGAHREAATLEGLTPELLGGWLLEAQAHP